MEDRCKLVVKERCSGKTAKAVIDMVIKVLKDNVDHYRNMQDQTKSQDKRIYYQGLIMHDLDLIETFKSMYLPIK